MMPKFNTSNYIINNIKEHIELQNDVKTKGIFMYKNRYAILTRERLIIFESKEKFLMKKNPRKNYAISDYQFFVDGRTLGVWKASGKENEIKLIKNVYFPSADICIHWWESIRYLKYQNSHAPAEEMPNKKQMDIRSNIFRSIRLRKSFNEHSIINSSFSLMNREESKTSLKSSSCSLSNSHFFFQINSVHSGDSFQFLKTSLRSSSAVPIHEEKNCDDSSQRSPSTERDSGGENIACSSIRNKIKVNDSRVQVNRFGNICNQEIKDKQKELQKQKQKEKEILQIECQASLQSKMTVAQEKTVNSVKFFKPRNDFHERNLILEKFNASRNLFRKFNEKKNTSATYLQIYSNRQQEQSKKVTTVRMFDNDYYLTKKKNQCQQQVKDINDPKICKISCENPNRKETILGSIDQSLEVEFEQTESVDNKLEDQQSEKSKNENYTNEDFTFQRRSLIESLVENCYSLRLLKMNVEENKLNSNLLQKIFGVLSKLFSSTDNNINVLINIFKKLPLILKTRISKLDPDIFSTITIPNRISKEVLKIIYADIDALIQTLEYFALKKKNEIPEVEFSNKEILFRMEMKCLQALIVMQIIKMK